MFRMKVDFPDHLLQQVTVYKVSAPGYSGQCACSSKLVNIKMYDLYHIAYK